MTPQGPLLVAARPVLKSDGSGPSRGTLIFGRVLKDKDVKELAEITRLPLSLSPPGAVNFRELKPAGLLKNGEPFYVKFFPRKRAPTLPPLRICRVKGL
ncbi:CHASE4 domain protein [Moorella thermoacetica]|uniref:CHASE4 domain protein n=1 Tax=Neomoorella thermoacetica TaxID=1525 RepID=A0A1J5JMW3_NEOTH|nr:CHASE4 domain protein [Moorella thermoacetica]OIQ60562.1 CHASE4 domain protein [Moorella thermoacetica]